MVHDVAGDLIRARIGKKSRRGTLAVSHRRAVARARVGNFAPAADTLGRRLRGGPRGRVRRAAKFAKARARDLRHGGRAGPHTVRLLRRRRRARLRPERHYPWYCTPTQLDAPGRALRAADVRDGRTARSRTAHAPAWRRGMTPTDRPRFLKSTAPCPCRARAPPRTYDNLRSLAALTSQKPPGYAHARTIAHPLPRLPHASPEVVCRIRTPKGLANTPTSRPDPYFR